MLERIIAARKRYGELAGSTLWIVVAASACTGNVLQAQPQQSNAQAGQQQKPHVLEAYVGENSAQAMYLRDLELDEIGTLEISGGAFFNEDRDFVAIIGALAEVGDANPSRRLMFSVGPRTYGAFLGDEDQDFFGVGVGGEARYDFGADRSIAVVLSAYYAPDILMFGEADSISDASLRIEAPIGDETTVFVGYRTFEIDLAVDREIDDNMHVGFRRRF